MGISARLRRASRGQSLSRRPLVQRLVTFLLVAVLLPLGLAAPAHAGSMGSSNTWTVMDPRTNVEGARYDWGFSTVTSSMVSRVAMTMPAGTTGANRELLLNGTSANNASTGDLPINSITGDIDIHAQIEPASWTPPAVEAIMGKMSTTTQRSYRLYLTTLGKLQLDWSTDGSTVTSLSSTTSVPFTGSQVGWVRAGLQVSDGAGHYVASFYTSTDGTSWNLLGSARTISGTTNIWDSTAPVEIGSDFNAGSDNFNGAIRYVDIRNAIAGTTSASACNATAVVVCFNPNNDIVGSTTWNAQTTGEPWALTRSASNLPADIGSDLSVMKVTGLGAGVAHNRENDANAVYVLNTPTTVGIGAVTLGLAGFTSTRTAASYSSTITTFDNSATPVSVDTGSTNSLSIIAPTTSTIAGSVTIYPSPTTATGVSLWPRALALSGTKVYVTDIYSSTVMALDTTSGNVTTFAGTGATTTGSNNIAATATQFWQPLGVAADGSGNVFVADSSQNNLRKITSGTVTSYANSSNTAGSNGDGTALTHYVNNPTSMVTDASGNLYFADTGNHCVREVTTGGTLTTVAGTCGSGGFSGDGSAATSALLNAPKDVYINTAGDLYIADANNNRIRKVDHTTLRISTVAGTGANNFGGDTSAATSAYLSAPNGITGDSSGNLYIADLGNSRIRKFTDGGTISTVAGSSTAASYGGDGGLATAANLASPTAVRIDGSGNIYVSDSANGRVRKFTDGGNISTVVGNGVTVSSSGDGGAAVAAHTLAEQQVWAMPSGDLYVADQGNQEIRKIAQGGGITTVAGSGPFANGNSGDNGPATAAKLNNPSGVAVLADGTIYIADTYNSSVRKVTPAGTITTLASVGTPAHIDLDSSNNLYVTSLANCRITKVTPAGVTSAYAGNGTCGFSGDTSTATSAQLNAPRNVSFDSVGNGYIADNNNGRVRCVSPAGIITTVAGGGAGATNNVLATSASLGSAVRGVVVDPSGAIIITNFSNLLRFTPGGPIFSIASAFGGGGIASANGQIYVSDYNNQVLRKVQDIVPTAPLVNADAMTVPSNTARNVPILSNDWSRLSEMDPSSVAITTAPSHGNATVSFPSTDANTLQVLYTPTTNYTGADSFVYQACDTTENDCASATVSLTVASNAVSTYAGGMSEGLASNIAFQPTHIVRSGNYLFLYDASPSYASGCCYQIGYGAIRRYDIYSKQLVTIAGGPVSIAGGDGGPAMAAELGSGGAMAFSQDGSLYFADASTQRVRVISPSGIISTIAGTGTGGTPTAGSAATSSNLTSPSAVAFDLFSNLNVATGNQVWSFPVGGNMTLVAGTGTAGSTGDTGLATSAQLSAPGGLAFSGAGDLYVSDTANNVIRKIHNSIITTVAGTIGVAGSSGDTGAATSAQLSAPAGIAIDSAGTISIADYSNNKVRTFTDGGIITSLSGGGISNVQDVATGPTTSTLYVAAGGAYRFFSITSGSAAALNNSANIGDAYGGDGLPASETQLAGSRLINGVAMAADATGNIYIAGPGARIRKIDATTKLVSTFVGNGVVGNDSSHVGSSVAGMAFDTSGRLYFTNPYDHLVRRVNLDLTITTITGNGTNTSSGDNGLATGATVENPWGIVVDKSNNVYIADSVANNIRKIDGTTANITTIAGTGTAGFSGDGMAAASAKISSPAALTIDSAGDLYFADKGNGRIRMIDTSGVINTVVGNGNAGLSADGTSATAASINNTSSVAIDGAGNLFFGDQSNARIREVDHTTGNLLTVAGPGAASLSLTTDASAASAANVVGPRSLIVSGNNVFFWGDGFAKLREVVGAAQGATAPIASASLGSVPGDVGHTNLRDRLTLSLAASVTSSKISLTLPSGLTGTPTVVTSYGISGTVTPSLSGSVLTLAFASQTLPAGVPITVGLEGITNGGSAQSFSSTIAIYDSAGSTVLSSGRSSVLKVSASGYPAPGDAGYATVLPRSLMATVTPQASISVSPLVAPVITTTFNISSSGVLNANAVNMKATAFTATVGTLLPVTASAATSVNAAAFSADRWGLAISTTSGTNGGATGPGLYSGLATSNTPVATGVPASNSMNVVLRSSVDYLTPAGKYTSQLTTTFTPGT